MVVSHQCYVEASSFFPDDIAQYLHQHHQTLWYVIWTGLLWCISMLVAGA